ncbi:MAG: SDR family NAD(P)-dependent oxidoreductase [Pseudomonadota bacterium]
MSITTTSAQIFNQWNHPINVAVVGASGGVGYALCQQLYACEHVSHVIRISRSSCPALNENNLLHKKITHDIRLDYEDKSSVKDQLNPFLELNIPIHILIIASGFLHNSTQGPEKKLEHFSHDFLMKNIRINASGPIEVIQTLRPQLTGAHQSVIAVLSAKVGSIEDNQIGGWYSYRTSKAALNMLLKTTSIEWRKYRNSAIVSVHPGTVYTHLSAPFTSSNTQLNIRSPAVAAEDILKVISQLSAKDNGRFLDYKGNNLPW